MTWSVDLRARRGTLALDVRLAGEAAPFVVVGPNGSGKSTLLRLLAGAELPDAGRIELAGRVLYDGAAAVCVPSEHRRIGYVPQGFGLFPHLSVLDNVAFGLSVGPRRVGVTERRDRARAMLEALSAGGLADRSVDRLSGGERQRVALARALVTEPDLLLLDEPFGALDATARRRLRVFLAEHLRTLGRPSIVVTHDLRDARALEARIAVLEGGAVVQEGTLAQIHESPATDFVAELVEW